MEDDPKQTIRCEVIRPEQVGLEPIQPVLPEDQPWPEAIREEAKIGIVGEFIEAVEPTTEADPNAILIQFLSGASSMLGGKLQLVLDERSHGLKIWTIVVGETSDGKKGTGATRVFSVLDIVDDSWRNRRRKGIVSGEAIVTEIRDDAKRVRTRRRGDGPEEDTVDTDRGVADKRLFVTEEEFGRILRTTRRSGTTLSAMIREAWDSDVLMTTAKRHPERATGAHVVIVGHITPAELKTALSPGEIRNGFANRFLYACSRSSKFLVRPPGLSQSTREQLASRLSAIRDFVKSVPEERASVQLSEDAWVSWGRIRREIEYEIRGADAGSLMLANVITRGVPYVLRMAALYAVLDRSLEVEPRHIEAAREVWRYSVNSARIIFGENVTDSEADKVWKALLVAPEGRLPRTRVWELLGRNGTARDLDRVRDVLIFAGKIRAYRDRRGPGRPVELWVRRGR